MPFGGGLKVLLVEHNSLINCVLCDSSIFIRVRLFGLTNPSDQCFFDDINSIECADISQNVDRLDRLPVQVVFLDEQLHIQQW
jgi:hypothetical protein